MCEKYLVMMEGGDHHEFVDSLDAVKKVVTERVKDLSYNTIEDYFLDYKIDVYEIAKQLEVSVETTYNWEFK